jgi:hypothetical protein
VEGSVAPPWWRSVDPRRVLVAGLLSFAALPVLVVDNLANTGSSAEAVETAATSTTETTVPPTTAPPTTVPPTTAPPTTVPPTTAPPTTAAPTTAPPTTAPRRVATTVAPTTAPPTTAPTTAPSGSVEATIRSWFPEVGDTAVAVARCESGLDPSAQSPSGYRGLFQLSPSHASSFAAVTGRDFEDAWDEAGPNSQYARYLYDRQGWAPWGACAP